MFKIQNSISLFIKEIDYYIPAFVSKDKIQNDFLKSKARIKKASDNLEQIAELDPSLLKLNETLRNIVENIMNDGHALYSFSKKKVAYLIWGVLRDSGDVLKLSHSDLFI